MKILNDMDCVPFNEGHNYFQKDDDGETKIFHMEMDFGVEINIADVHRSYIEGRGPTEDVNVLGILICMNGSVETTMDEGTFTSLPGTAVFGHPRNQRHDMLFPAGQFQGIAIGFRPGANLPKVANDPDSRYMLATLMERFRNEPFKPFWVPIEMCMLAESIMIDIQENGGSNREFLRRRCAEMLHLMYWMGRPKFVELHNYKNMVIVDRMCSELNADLTVIPNIKQMCEDQGINEFWFIRNFKKRYGYTPYEYHKMAKHMRAAALLLNDRHSVGEISKMIGYTSQSKFSMAFKEIMGCRPKHYPHYFEEKLIECAHRDDFDF